MSKIETELKTEPVKIDIPVPVPIVQLLQVNNDFLKDFINRRYNYKQRTELQASELRSVLTIEENMPGECLVRFRLLIELLASDEMMVLFERAWHESTENIKLPGFQATVAKHIHQSYYLMMRHGLATVIRTAQKKGANLII
jgi:hypothetical protein